MVVYIDFDGVLFLEDGSFPGVGPPILGAAAAMTSLREAGCKIVIYSARASRLIQPPKLRRQHRVRMVEALRAAAIPYDEIHDLKPPYDVLIDDRVVTPVLRDWGTVLEEVWRIGPIKWIW